MFNFGPEAAQNDTELLSYFHTTQQVKTLINQKISTQDKDCIFAVRPGGGKTALVKWLNSEEHQHNVLVLPTSKTRFITDDSKPNIEDYRNLISAELYAWMISESLEKFKLSEPLREKLKEYFKWSWTEPIKGFFKGKFEGLTILGFGFSLKASDRKSYLKEIREKRKLTLRKVQDLTGVSNAYLSQVENGRIKKPSPQVLHKLADCFRIQYERLLKLTGYPAPENNMAQAQYRTGDWIEDVTPEEEERLKEYLEFLRSRKG